jgi:hypothetical protein
MNFPFQALVELLPPPEVPIETHGEWAQIERQLGTSLPADYKWFIETYGTGSICIEFVRVLNPFAENRAGNLLSCGAVTLEWLRENQDHTALRVNDYPVFPEPGGILPWGTSGNGHEFFWLTQGEPDTWSVVLHDRDRLETRLYERTCMTMFLVILLSGQLDAGNFRIHPRMLDDQPRFKTPNQILSYKEGKERDKAWRAEWVKQKSLASGYGLTTSTGRPLAGSPQDNLLPESLREHAEELLKLLPRPEYPFETRGDWELAETKLGTPLPADYKWFIETYGTGEICKGFTAVLNPFAARKRYNLLAVSERHLRGCRRMQEHLPNPVYPEPGGILPWGINQTSICLYWLTRGKPENWGIEVHVSDSEAGGTEIRVYETMTMVQFLVILLSQLLPSGEMPIPDHYLNYQPRFDNSRAV